MLFRRRCTAGMCVLVIGLPGALPAQAAATRPAVPVRGIAFDSVRGQPIRNAFIAMMGVSAGTTTDANGRFHFDSVAPGTYTFALQHALLDSLGLSGLSTRAIVGPDGGEVRIAVPSFATLWRAACRAGRPPRDSGFVYGTVRDVETHRPAANATVRVRWVEMLIDKQQGFMQRNWHLETHADSTGGYALCGVPMDGVNIQVQATSDSGASGVLDFPTGDVRVFRRDILLGAFRDSASSRRGTIVGLLTDIYGDPYFNARVVMDGVPEVRTGADGHFTLHNVPVGTRQIEFRSVGMVPVTTAIDVAAGDTTPVFMSLGNVTTLEAMRVERSRRGKALAIDFEARRKLGIGYSFDTTAILKFDNVSSIFQNVPSLTAQFRGPNMLLSMPNGRGGTCRPAVRLDGVLASYMNLADLSPREVADVEVFPRASQIPAGYSLPVSDAQCGMILVWTRYGFRER